MPARCHEDSCTVKWSEVNTLSGPAYQADVDLNPAWMVCEDPAGIRPILSPNAGNIIGNPGNGLFASLPGASLVALSANPDPLGVAPLADDGSPQSSDNYVWTNTSGRPALAIVSGTFHLRYAILGPLEAYSYASGAGSREPDIAGLTPYNANAAFRVDFGVNGPAVSDGNSVAARADIGGLLNTPATANDWQLKTTRIPFSRSVRVPVGGVLNIRGRAWWEGPDQTINLIAADSLVTGLATTGFELWNLQLASVSADPI